MTGPGETADAAEARIRHNAADLGLTIPQALSHDHLMGMRMSDWPQELRDHVARSGPVTCGQQIADTVADWLRSLGDPWTPPPA